MTYRSLHPDDLPPAEITAEDISLRQKLEDSLGKRFYESCAGVTQALLIHCNWHISSDSSALTLILDCPDQALKRRVLNNLLLLGHGMAEFSSQARIRVCLPEGMGEPFEIRVDELSMYHDSL